MQTFFLSGIKKLGSKVLLTDRAGRIFHARGNVVLLELLCVLSKSAEVASLLVYSTASKVVQVSAFSACAIFVQTQ